MLTSIPAAAGSLLVTRYDYTLASRSVDRGHERPARIVELSLRCEVAL
jgi:hypothetical protein